MMILANRKLLPQIIDYGESDKMVIDPRQLSEMTNGRIDARNARGFEISPETLQDHVGASVNPMSRTETVSTGPQRSIRGFMNKFQRQWDAQRAVDAQEEMRRQRAAQAEEGKKRESDGGGDQKKDSKPASKSGLNTPSASIAAPGPATGAVIPFERRENVGAGGSTGHVTHYDAGKAPPYLDAIADKYGINRDDFKRMAFVESGFETRAHNPSGASGLFQFMPGTARQYGLRNPYDGVANAEAAARLWNDNRASLTRSLGREPSAGELYLAHQQGVGGAARLLSNPGVSAASLVGAKAVTQNGGSAGMSAGDFANMWTRKFDDARSTASNDGSTPRNRDAGNPASPYRVASASTANDASPTRAKATTSTPGATLPTDPRTPAPEGYFWDLGAAGSKPRLVSRATGQDMAGQPMQPAGSVTTSAATPAATTPSTSAPATNTTQTANPPLPPRRPDDLGRPETPLPPRRPDELSQPQQQESSETGKGIGGFLDSVFGPPPKDEYGREWDPLYGFERPSESAAQNGKVASMLDTSSQETAAKSIFAPGASANSGSGGIGDLDFSPALNFFSTLFG